jgi:hypothetical protein
MRRIGGQSLIEVTIGLVIFVPVVLTLLDLSVIFFATQQNENLCRSAAEAAASCDPAQSQARVLVLVDRQNASSLGSMVSHFRLVQPIQMKVTSAPTPVEDLASDETFNPGGPVTGTATVATAVDVKPFVVQAIYAGKTPLTFESKHSFPIKYIMPAQRKPQ